MADSSGRGGRALCHAAEHEGCSQPSSTSDKRQFTNRSCANLDGDSSNRRDRADASGLSGGTGVTPLKGRKKKHCTFDWSRARMQRVLLKIAYNGEAYAGLAAQAEDSGIPTVEDALFKAMERACLIPNRFSCNFSRCGRTDKGVHAAGNYISLNLRVLDKAPKQNDGCRAYVPLLNRLLPPDIRVLSAAPVPPGFDARFDCLYRVYKYFFATDGLDVELMRGAAKRFVGTHNFLRFCKVDRKQERSLWRRILRFDVEPQSRGFAVATIVGVSFLWHQVRFMMSALIDVGSGIRHASFISFLLRDGLEAEATQSTTALGPASDDYTAGTKGGETMQLVQTTKCSPGGGVPLCPAPAGNLVLYDCCFEGLYFHRNGVVNRLIHNATETDPPQLEGKEPYPTEQQFSPSQFETLAKSKESARKRSGIGAQEADYRHDLCHRPGCTEESRPFQEEYIRCAYRMMVLKCLCEHSLPPW